VFIGELTNVRDALRRALNNARFENELIDRVNFSSIWRAVYRRFVLCIACISVYVNLCTLQIPSKGDTDSCRDCQAPIEDAVKFKTQNTCEAFVTRFQEQGNYTRNI